jgi:MHS family proline/betaine transporter-like MFS transporter
MGKNYITYKAIVAVLLGNAFEFYCFILFVVLSPYIGKAFFSNANETVSQIVAYGISFCGYASRPFGAMLLGNMSDIYSRKKALCWSVLITGIITFLIGVLPVYKHVDVITILVLIFLRFGQGFLVSGEEGGAAVYLAEVIEGNKKCLIGSLVLSSVFFGILSGRVVCNVVEYYSSSQFMYDYGWRIPFLIALPLALIINRMRSNVPEIKWQSNIKQTFNFSPIKELFSKYKKCSLQLIMCCSAYASITCFMMVYLPNACKTYFPAIIFTSGIGVMMIMLPIFGLLSDIVTPGRLLKNGLLAAIILTVPAVYMLAMPGLLFKSIGLFWLYFNTSLIAAPMFPYLVQSFPRNNRCTGVSFVFNTSVSIFSGAFPFVCSIINIFNIGILIPAYLIMGLAILSYVLLLNTSKHAELFQSTNHVPYRILS